MSDFWLWERFVAAQFIWKQYSSTWMAIRLSVWKSIQPFEQLLLSVHKEIISHWIWSDIIFLCCFTINMAYMKVMFLSQNLSLVVYIVLSHICYTKSAYCFGKLFSIKAFTFGDAYILHLKIKITKILRALFLSVKLLLDSINSLLSIRPKIHPLSMVKSTEWFALHKQELQQIWVQN